ncbi:hypothetical protein BV20DRAFT_932928 [Pilatotrama ljubarskyi]|nr:hypothetical protein BV20DRAFT_932928 [Pilatotrama ljubarskyi]
MSQASLNAFEFTWSVEFAGRWTLQLRACPLQGKCFPDTVQEQVNLALATILRGPVRLRDYALYVDGGRVWPPLTSNRSESAFAESPRQLHPPEVALSEDIRIGNCWESPQMPSQLAVVLDQLIHPTNVTIDHIPLEIAADIGEAPRHLLLWGVVEGTGNHGRYHDLRQAYQDPSPGAAARFGPSLRSDTDTYALLADFTYDIHAPLHIQTFQIDPRVVESRMDFGLIVLEILDNWGSNSTCLYRLRIHGSDVEL